ncbi:alpha-mannosidase 2C1-like isoform X2 [Homarus americanus]|uniref:alpha-mannosidase n=2 Tax=Homarus americanus TaxID=6706 RepID=A0A8J5MS50_HOMAM|nr:alpha-mannosidase 2C1-like isoform X2 [Homarus americanus]XP_042234065.1 alpha-mannosidase 2C1-like isoform X2 [Homarus americanus]XP_042234066.1 alpha-mannosidase 2C1-like isoform X2 [Homarus americanus]XP_042234067.1 alpha-mannosidase 2C1-like isoform X2 [Homarus americanus]KAG7162125.1 Alpha-mannosidase 2C1-like 1 [Homarus americanus]
MDEDVKASMHKNRRTTLERIEKYISDKQFRDVNLRGKLYPFSKEIDCLSHWCVPGGEAAWEQWPFKQVITQDFKPTSVGKAFGPLWSTHWFRIEVKVPDSWKGQQVWLQWNSQAEAMLWSRNGEPLQGMSPGGYHHHIRRDVSTNSQSGQHEKQETENDHVDSHAEGGLPHQTRTDYPISRCWNGSQETLVYYIELACNNMFGGGKEGMISPPDPKRTFKIERAEICTMDADVYKLIMDLEVLHDMAKTLPNDDPCSYEALYAGNQMINTIIKNDYRMASKIANTFFSKGNGARAHTVALMGHCHIDSAWLWPYSETKRKCARSWTSTLNLMEEYPEMRFACSQAQQFSWMKSHYPAIFEKIRTQVKAGRFIPVGGSWVEMDGLIPSGESFMRQFLYGQLFYQREFGIQCKEFWLPDTFGYSAQFPQICKQFGITRFLTQKLSWNMVNKFPHHNFLWEGLDGTTIIAHFPPGDSYEMNVKVGEAMKTVRNLQDKGRVSTSAFLYGYGNGGGGPTREMMERARRLKDVDGCPRMEHMSPNTFFKRLESEKQNLCRWTGELFLELHNGTYTSQANTKRQNRECEIALRDAEMMLAFVAVSGELSQEKLHAYQEALVGAWKKVLLNQFHDVIPGTSIGHVYRDADQMFQESQALAAQIKEACAALILQDTPESRQGDMVVVNTFPWKVQQVVTVKEKGQEPSKKRIRMDGEVTQPAQNGEYYVAVEAQGIGWTKLLPMCPAPVTVRISNGNYILENSLIRAEITKYGQVISLTSASDVSHNVFKKSDGPQCYGNQLMMYDDIPLYWDAWDTMDYHLETAKVLNEEDSGCVMTEMKVLERGPLVVKLQWEMKISNASSLTQEIELSAVSPHLTFNNHVNWHENRKFLKVAFNTGFMTRNATFDTQFGYIERPTHTNTSWESAKFEVSGHKWADLSEHDFGMAVMNDSKYGWSARGSKLTLSLLRSPKAPDEHCDIGTHNFRYALMPHNGSFQSAGVQRRAYEFNNTLMISSTTLSEDKDTWYSLVGDGAMIEAVKLAEDKTGDVVVRLYEMEGGSPKVWLKVPSTPRPRSAYLCSGLEDPYKELSFSVEKDNKYLFIALNLTPFKIVNVRISYG